MTVACIWTFPSLDVKRSAFGLPDVVYGINWVCSAGDGQGHTAQVYGSCPVPFVAEDAFTQYGDLTEEIVLGWLTENLGDEQMQKIEDDLSMQIDDQINPKRVTILPPWQLN